MIDVEFLKVLDRFDIIVRKKVVSSFQGSRASQSYGRGLVFQDYREYVPGDDFRSIDWKVYARTDSFYIRRFEEERNLTVHVLVDASASMNFGKQEKKFNYAAMVGLGFAYMALKNNESFVFSTFADHLLPYRPKKGVKQIVDVMHHVNQLKIEGKSNFRECLRTYKKVIKTKSMIIVISDFLFDLEEMKSSLLRFKRSELVVVQVLDPMERSLDLSGDLILHDSESDSMLRTFVSRRLREKYRNLMSDHVAKIQDFCDSIGAKFVCVYTDQPIFDTFYKVLAER
ncbi:MAG: DUF58 domain-containing protein [Nanoarchaeota archaeon]|nr:DUF58 domain-containing protein [Nanoarchaeota archaeon]